MSPCTRRMAGGWCILSLTLVLAAAPAGAESARHVSAGDRDTVQAFVAERLFSPDAARLPYRFLVDGKSSEQLLPEWTRSEQSESLDAGRTRRVVQYTDPKSGLAVRCEAVVYRDFPTVEWKLLLRNTGTAPTPLVEAVQPLDTTWQRGDDAEFLLHHAVGSQAGPSDYGPIDTPLPPGAVQRYAGAGGRPTNKDWSYFNLQWGDRGVIVVVGWPGQWAGEFARDAGRGLRVRAGQEVLRARLEPGEEIRTPLMVLQFWSGRYEESQNVWRRWMMAYGMPHPGGKLPPPQCVA